MSKCNFCGRGARHLTGCPNANHYQPAPIPNTGTHIVDLVKADLDRRRALGIQKYGTALQANNGRDALQDAYEEALDLCQYLKQAIEERNQKEVPRG